MIQQPSWVFLAFGYKTVGLGFGAMGGTGWVGLVSFVDFFFLCFAFYISPSLFDAFFEWIQ